MDMGEEDAMIVEGEEEGAQQLPGEGTGLQLPFGVATLDTLLQRAYINNENKPEWLFTRVHAYLGLKMDPGKFLRNNKASIQAELQGQQVPIEGFHYRGKESDGDQWQDHTFESRALIVLLLWILKNKAMKALVKVKTLTLLLEMVTLAFQAADVRRPFMAMLVKPNGVLVSQELLFSEQSICRNWAQFIDLCPGAIQLWKKLGVRTWQNKCITSAVGTATLNDVLTYFAYIFCHQKIKVHGQKLWDCLLKPMLPEWVVACGKLLDLLALKKSGEQLQSLPVLRGKSGHARRIADPVNKLLLLFKLEKAKKNRREIASTHQELGGATGRLMVYENYLDCLLRKKVLEKEFQGVSQISVCWDPSTYGGKEVLMSVAYSPHLHKACYLMSQQMIATMVSELADDLIPLAKSRRLTRLEGFKEIKALSSALESIGLSLQSFQIPPGLHCRPLTASQYRLEGDRAYIFEELEDGNEQIVPEVPVDMDLGKLPCLVSISDQGPNIIGAVNYLQYHPEFSILFLALFDPFHRAWNDLKLALKRCSYNGWKTVLELTLVCNINYGPFGSSAWFFKKKAKHADFMATESAYSQMFQRYQHRICQEKRIKEPATFAGLLDLFDSLKDLQSFQQKGPLIKLMRWFSFFETMTFYSGELVATKMIMEHAADTGVGEEASEKEVDEGPPQQHQDPRKELSELKKRKGSWKLAPQLITDKALAIKDCIMSVGKASWKFFAARARDIVAPEHVLQHNISCCWSGFWKQELIEMIFTSLHDERCLQHLTPEFRSHEMALEWQEELFHNLLEQRAMSLAAGHCLPPMMYGHVAAPSPEVALDAHMKAKRHWQILLQAESASNAGANVQPLEFLHWRQSPMVRTIYMAFEQDARNKAVFTTESAALKLVMVVAKSLGDSRLVENIHQFGRDLFRQSKANTFGNTTIMANALRSKVLEKRKVPVVSANPGDKALGPAWDQKCRGSVVDSMKSYGKKVPLSIQKLMKKKDKSHTWPTPGPHALFQSSVATQWLFEFWENKNSTYKECNVNSAWVSFLARPGSIVAQQSTGLMLKVCASAEFGFLGAVMSVVLDQDGGRSYVCKPKRQELRFFYVVDLDDWLELPVTPCMVNERRGPIGWKLTEGATPLPLETAALMCGQTITHSQLQKLMGLFSGMEVKKNQSKESLWNQLVDMLVAPQHQELARSHLKAKAKKEDEAGGYDTDFSEVISELDNQDGNQNDLKEYKQKRRLRLKKLLKRAADEPIEGKKKRPKAKAKGKAKAKAKPKAQPKDNVFWRNFARKQQEKRREEAEQKRETGMDLDQGKEQEKEQEKKQEKEQEKKQEKAQDMEAGEAQVPQVEPPSTEGGASSSKAAAPRAPKRKSPEEVMSMLQPSGCKFGLSYQDHRFVSVWKAEHKELAHPYSQKRLSRSFADRREWKEALKLVHDHNWSKWLLLQGTYPLQPGQRLQTPGEIDDEVFDMLEETIKSLGEVVRYA